MPEQSTPQRVTPRGGFLKAATIGILCATVWVGLAVWLIPAERLSSLAGIASVLLPLLLIALVTGLARSLALLRNEAAGLRQDLDAMRDLQSSDDAQVQVRAPEPNAVRAPPVAQPALQTPPATLAPPVNRAPQGTLALEPVQPAPVPLTTDELISALQFPETPEDQAGFRALRRAMNDHRTALVVRAAQDVLTLLSQDGIYMDDLPPDRAHPDLWRRFIHGERGGQIATIGGIRAADALEVSAMRLRENAVFRDAVHHFVRRFDKQLSDVEPEISDADLARLTDTRSARAFMLLGRAMGVFG